MGSGPRATFCHLYRSLVGVFPYSQSALSRDNASVRIKGLLIIALGPASFKVQLVLSWSEIQCQFGDMKVV